MSRSRTWHFSHTLYTSLKPEAARRLSPTSSIDPWDFIKRMFHDLFKQGPATVFYIHLRVSRQAFDHCVACGKSGSALPDLPFPGFIQATSTVRKTILQRCLDAVLTPVGSKLCSDPQYQKEFMEPAAKTAAAFVHFLVRGEPALGVGGRKRKQPKAPAPPPAHGPDGGSRGGLPPRLILALLASACAASSGEEVEPCPAKSSSFDSPWPMISFPLSQSSPDSLCSASACSPTSAAGSAYTSLYARSRSSTISSFTPLMALNQLLGLAVVMFFGGQAEVRSKGATIELCSFLQGVAI